MLIYTGVLFMIVFEHAPCYESEVLILFGLLLNYMKKYGMDITVKECSGNYPDCILLINNIETRAEFEVYASNFLEHKHDPRKCDMIICWENDLEQPPVKVLELKKYVIDLEKDGIKFFETYLECPLYRQWNEEQFFKILEKETNKETHNLIRELYDYVIELSRSNPSVGIKFGKGKKIPTIDFVFRNVTHKVIISIQADGKISINYSSCLELPAEVERRLREIIGEYEKQWHYIKITPENIRKMRQAIKFLTSYNTSQKYNAP